MAAQCSDTPSSLDTEIANFFPHEMCFLQHKYNKIRLSQEPQVSQMPHQQPMVCGCGMPGLGLPRAKTPSISGRTVPAFVMGTGLGLAPDHWLGPGA